MRNRNQGARPIWVRTYTGRKINILDLKPDDISAKDIAHHLSLQNRFIGATPHAYSTAQHSIHVMQLAEHIAPKAITMTTEKRLQALLHDCEEAYTGDIITPIKKDNAGSMIRELGNFLRGDILEILGLVRVLPAYIKEADTLICAQEVRDLIGDDPADWDLPTPFVPSKIVAWPAWLAEQRFLGEFNRLTNALRHEREMAALSVSVRASSIQIPEIDLGEIAPISRPASNEAEQRAQDGADAIAYTIAAAETKVLPRGSLEDTDG